MMMRRVQTEPGLSGGATEAASAFSDAGVASLSMTVPCNGSAIVTVGGGPDRQHPGAGGVVNGFAE